jgi:acyl transferase domain-containing protein
MTSTRFDLASHYDLPILLKNRNSAPNRYSLISFKLLDTMQFSMSPREAAQTDPLASIFLKTVHKALVISGYRYNRTHATEYRNIAVYSGQTSDDYEISTWVRI